LTPEQKRHWDTFAADHAMQECSKCHEWYLVCHHDPQNDRLQVPVHGADRHESEGQ
jgi:hypothetical protein